MYRMVDVEAILKKDNLERKYKRSYSYVLVVGEKIHHCRTVEKKKSYSRPSKIRGKEEKTNRAPVLF